MFELQDHRSVPKNGNRFAGQLVLALSCTISMVLVAWIFLANFLQSNDKIEILPAGMSPEKADSFLKGLDEGRRALFAEQLRNEIQARPLNPEPIKKLAALAQTGTNVSEGDDLVMLAANRVWRDVALQSSALKLELDKRDYAAAISRLNIVYFTQPDKESDVLKVLAGMMAPQSFDALVEALAQNPKWRSILLQTLAINPDVSIDVIYALFSALRHAGSPPTQQELRVFIYRLVTTGAEDKGYFVWLDSLGPESLRKAGFIHDGGFDLTLNNQFFSWTFDQMPSVDGRIASRTPGSIDKVFRLDFAPARSFFKNLSQYLKLPSGSYRTFG